MCDFERFTFLLQQFSIYSQLLGDKISMQAHDAQSVREALAGCGKTPSELITEDIIITAFEALA